MSARAHSQEEIEAAIEEIGRPGAFAEAERSVAAAAPALQKILGEAMMSGGWFGESHDSAALKAATVPDPDERLIAVKTLLAEEARMGMMVGVAVGWALADKLAGGTPPDEKDPKEETPE